MTKIREYLSIEQVLSQVIKKLDENEIKNITNKSISHFRKCSDTEDKDHNIHLGDAIKLDILMQRKELGTPLLDKFELTLNEEFKKVNSFDRMESVLINIGGRVGNLMEVAQEAIDPEGPLGKELSDQEKDRISTAISEVEEKIAKLKLSIK